MYLPIVSVTCIIWDANKSGPDYPDVDWIVLPQKSFVETLAPNVIAFEQGLQEDA